jgi:transposase InsO family protein
LQIAPSGYWRYAQHKRIPDLRCARAQQDEVLMPQITQVWQENFCVYGADKIWRALNRMGTTVARCTVERLMKRLRLQGAKRGKKVRTTIPDELADRPSDLVKRRSKPIALINFGSRTLPMSRLGKVGCIWLL